MNVDCDGSWLEEHCTSTNATWASKTVTEYMRLLPGMVSEYPKAMVCPGDTRRSPSMAALLKAILPLGAIEVIPLHPPGDPPEL